MRFRTDIEGLRAVAVLIAVLFHARIRGLDAGFVGVDVSFVISAYLITGSMLEETRRSGAVSLTDFWARRIRRLLPSSLLLFLMAAPFAFADAPRLGWSRLALDLRSALLYFSNVRFSIKSEDDFAAADGASYFLHSWSLSLEEQFYLLCPVACACLAWAARCFRVAT